VALFENSQVSPACPSDNSSIYGKMVIEHWWSDNDRGKLKYSEKNLSHCHFPTFRKIVSAFDTSVTAHPNTKCQVPGELNP
jgi:hypothetical protein